MYNLPDYGAMIGYASRTSAYARALAAMITPGAVVLDMGAGPGIMSLLACRAGAAKVYAVESEDVIQLARQIAADNGFSSNIECIQAMTTEIDLPEKVDGIVSDVHGPTPLAGKSLVSILDARDRFLKPRGWIIPRLETVWGALVNSATLYDRFSSVWDTEYAFDFRRARGKACNTLGAGRARAGDLLVAPERWAALDYGKLESPNVSGEMSWSMDRDGIAHGVLLWFDSETAPGFGFSNSPECVERNVYQHLFLPFPEAVELMAGDQVKVRLRADFVQSDYVWSWDTRVMSKDRVKSEFRQSTFNGAPLSADRLRKRAHSFIPEPNEDALIDSLGINLIRQKLSLNEIANALLAQCPARFKTWNAALARAADLSERYSK